MTHATPPVTPSDAEFRSGQHTFQQDWPALAAWLNARGHRLDLTEAPRQFAGGVGNFNFLVRVDDAPAVLRRPPPGTRPRGGNDMAREYRALVALNPHQPLTPRAIAFCEDESVLGASFLLSEFRAGRVIRGDRFDAPPATRRAVSEMLVRMLADLHRTPLEALQAADLGKPHGFVARTAAGWRHRAIAASGEGPSTVLVDVADWLVANAPPDVARPTLLHNDFKLDNVVVDPVDPTTPRAVLDWDMATVGEPLFDLAMLLAYWSSPNDPPAMLALRQMPSTLDGFLTRREASQLYGDITGADMGPLVYFRALAQFKLAVVLLQLHARWRGAPDRFPEFQPFAAVAEGLFAFTRDIIDQRVF